MKTLNLDLVVALSSLFVILLISTLKTHTTRGFRVRILLMAADAAGIVYFAFGKWAAILTVITGLILRAVGGRSVRWK